ncbi:MAG TPA: 50S ribosomal protein L3 [Candidatus Hydrogenedentes bacterium]|nr:50S ribosomal protein L3 [Candidatus Hydrogenedentota bacterium]
MLNGILGRKVGMTRLFTADGRWIPVTLIEAGPCTVVQRKSAAKDGYDAVQLGFGEAKEGRCTMPVRGHFKAAGVTPKRHLFEFRVTGDDELKPGDEIKTDIFAIGEFVDVTGTSKGKGFAGVIKRHHYSGGPGTHGSNFHRAPGSIGQSAYPAEVYKGKGLPGHMGDERVTAQNVEVVDVDSEKNLLVVRGAVPGANGGLLMVRRSVKGRVRKAAEKSEKGSK